MTIDSRVVNNGAAKPSAVADPSDSTLTTRNQRLSSYAYFVFAGLTGG